jgi:hypothetical protein
MSRQEALEMLACEFESLWLAITQIEAQEMIKEFQIADYPHLKAKDKSRVYKDIHKLAYPDNVEKVMDAKTVASILKRGAR